MRLAEKLAHLVRGANRSGVGTGAASAFARVRRLAPALGAGLFCLVMLCGGFVLGMGGSAVPSSHHRAAAHTHGHRLRSHAARADDAGNAALARLGATAVHLAPATAAPTAAPASLVDQPPLAGRENFAFAPYWTLPQSSSFSITGLSTLAYFSVDVNANGTLDEGGPGWSGFQSQALADLITRAHAAGERVVLTVTDFDQGSLDALTSSPTAAGTLAAALVPLLQAKSLDGVNYDFEGEGSGDQAGLTNLIAAVSSALRAADPHWQITMDTYASSAGDRGGFYDIGALAPSVDAFFVMDYELNLAGTATAASPLTSGMFSSQTTLAQYTAAAPASKVILGHAVLRHRLAHRQRDDGGHRHRRGGRHRGLAGAGERTRVLGPGDAHRLDELPGRRPVARVLLRGRQRPLRRLAAGVALRRPRRGHLGARHGERRGAADRGARRHLAGQPAGDGPAGHEHEPGRRPGRGTPGRRGAGGRLAARPRDATGDDPHRAGPAGPVRPVPVRRRPRRPPPPRRPPRRRRRPPCATASGWCSPRWPRTRCRTSRPPAP